MENASKALLMAGAVLIGILIVSLAVYLFVSFGQTTAEANKQIEADQLNQFNSQYTVYLGREDLTIYDVITVANMAKENNLYYDLSTSEGEKSFYIKVELKSRGNIESLADADKNNLMTNSNWGTDSTGELHKYKCTNVLISQLTRRVYQVNFEKIS